jgi:hypothetical protein
VNHDPREALGLPQSEVLPRAAAIGGLVDAVAVRDRVADEALTGADVDDVRVVGLRRDGADRQRAAVVDEAAPT